MMRISFSTISCPSYTVDQVAAAADEYGYDGIELYALAGERLTPAVLRLHRADLRRTFRGDALPIVCINSWAHLTGAILAAQEAQILSAFELAADLCCPLVKVFGGDFPADEPPAAVYDRVADTVTRLCERAVPLGVRLVLETHDSFSRGASVAEVLRRADHGAFGALWDVFHTHRMGETIEETDTLIGARVAHVHVKDAVWQDDEWRFVLLGDGELPVAALIDRLALRGYAGYISVDWEKMWHPEIAGPEIALPRFATVLHQYIAGALAARDRDHSHDCPDRHIGMDCFVYE
jgi:sugar phosphate isomerase/epimerase